VSTLKGRMAVIALWFFPDWIVRWFPPSFSEVVEREVYDGLTRHEWFMAQIAEMQALNAKQAAEKGGVAKCDENCVLEARHYGDCRPVPK